MLHQMTLKWGDYPGLSRWVQNNHKRPDKREAKVSGMVNTVTETQVGGMRFEDGSMGHEPSNAGTI